MAEVERLTGGKLDYLVNNAGRNYTVPALDVDMDEIRQTFEVNVFAVMALCQAFAPLLIEVWRDCNTTCSVHRLTSTLQAKGTIVQIGSVAGVMPYIFGRSSLIQ